MRSSTPELFDSYANLRLAPPDHEERDLATIPGERLPTLNGRLCDITQHWPSPNVPGDCYLTTEGLSERVALEKRFRPYSIVLRRNVHQNTNERYQVNLEIQSEALRVIFRRVAFPLRTVNLYRKPIIVRAPYRELYHFRHELEKASRALDQTLTVEAPVKAELEVLLKFIDETFADTIREVDSLVEAQQITQEYLWALFKPGDMVLLRRQKPGEPEETRCGILQHYFCPSDVGGPNFWRIFVRYMAFVGGKYGAVEERFDFPGFEGQVDITTLQAYPLRYCENASKVMDDLLARGKKFITFSQNIGGSGRPLPMSYQGPMWIQQQKGELSGCEFGDSQEKLISGRVMIDPEGYNNDHALFRRKILPGRLLRVDDNNPATGGSFHGQRLDSESLTKKEIMSLPSRIEGYSLVTKEAGFFLVDGFKAVGWEADRANDILQTSIEMRKALKIASGFSYQSQEIDYRIESKGKGLVFLLYGQPGTGKTMTAEYIAEALRRPLYRVSGDDLRTTPAEVEERLTLAFNRTSRWKGIILFDEADAFMTKRGVDNITRNAMVCVLLRLLEYQPTIVFLTTNRREEFDTAFYSRIHVSIEYTGLGHSARKGIWRSEMDRVWEGNHAFSDSDFDALAELETDARTIKNAVHVLKLYIGDRMETLVTLSDLKQVLELATGSVGGHAKEQVQKFCREGEEDVRK